MATFLGKAAIDTSHSSFGALNFAKVDGLQELRFGSKNGGVGDTSGCGDDLATSSVDGVRVQRHVVDIYSDSSHLLIAQHTLVGGPLESSNNGILDLVQVLYSLGHIDNNVGAGTIGAPAPDLTGVVYVPTIIFIKGELFTNEPENKVQLASYLNQEVCCHKGA